MPASELVLLTGLTGLALVLRLVGLDQSLFGDELFLHAIIEDRSLGQALSSVHDTEKTPPFGFVLAWLSASLGDAPELARLPSVLASVATVPLVYLLGVRTTGRPAGLVAAAWFALSPFQIFYGTESRSYALVTALVVLSTLALLLALDERRTRWWVLYAAAAVGAVYTHYIAALVLGPQAVWALLAHRECWREQCIAGGAVLLAFLPWLPSFVVQADNSAGEARRIADLVPFTLTNLAELGPRALVGHPFVPFRDLPGWTALSCLGGLVAGTFLVFLGGVSVGRIQFKPRLAGRGSLLLLLTLAPFVILVAYSLRPETSFLLPRNLNVAVPYALLLIGWLLTFHGGRLGLALSLAALALVSVGSLKMLTSEYQRPDARDAARYIDAQAPAGAPVAEASPFAGPPARAVSLYLDRPHRVYSEELSGVWPQGARTGSPVFLSFPGVPALETLFVVPPEYADRYRLADEHRSPGIVPIVTRKFVPR